MVRPRSAKPLSTGSNPVAASIIYAGVAELADAHDSKSCSSRSAGSTPATGITGRFETVFLFGKTVSFCIFGFFRVNKVLYRDFEEAAVYLINDPRFIAGYKVLQMIEYDSITVWSFFKKE